MAKDGLVALLCAGMLLGPSHLIGPPRAAAGDERETAIASALAVQTALQQGRDLLLKSNYQAAVYVLESQLPRINGNREYLATLRDAYRGHVKELRLTNQEASAQVYMQRLLILDPGAILDPAPRGPTAPPPQLLKAAAEPAPKETSSPTATIRMQKEEDPIADFHARQGGGQDLVVRAEKEFAGQRYEEAARFYDQAHLADPNSTGACRDRYAYCKLYQVAQRLGPPLTKGASLTELEKDVQRAVSLSPKMQTFGQEVLRKIAEHRSAAATQTAPAVAVRHGERTAEGWYLAETTNFRIYHKQNRDLVERVAEIAERTRVEMARKWLGETGDNWNPRCDLILHATAQEYSKATGVPAGSPGHSTLRTEGSRVLGRRIDLHCDDPNMLGAVLPHETTHVVLAGKFGEQPVPRWVDEGIAVLTEPREKVERHLRNLPQFRQNQQLLGVRQLMQLNDYPEPRSIGPFYAQSVSVVEFLAGEKGPETFTRFVREGLRTGYEPALKRYYGYQDFNELEQHWRRHAFREGAVASSAAERIR